jgi:hypothetical protein
MAGRNGRIPAVSKRGKCGKGKPFKKQGLTPTEAHFVKLMLQDMKDRWAALLSKNKWKPQK